MRTYTDDQFAELWQRGGCSPSQVAKLAGLAVSNVYRRRAYLASKGIILPTVSRTNANHERYGWQDKAHAYKARVEDTVKDGQVIIGSDCHYWPGEIPLAHEALCILVKRLKPEIICLNGDVFDGARVSRHEPLGWQKLPTVIEELDTCKARLAEIERAAPKARKYWTVGNHDSRYDRRLATEISQFEDVPGMSLRDHFKAWPMSYSLMLNESCDQPVMVKHAFRGGIHAIYNNTLHAGISIVTGHLHAQLCRPFTDYRGTRYGVDTGCIADIDGAQFSYTLDGPVNWRSGFGVLTFDGKGRLMPPELCEVQRFKDGQRAVFRGEVIAERKA